MGLQERQRQDKLKMKSDLENVCAFSSTSAQQHAVGYFSKKLEQRIGSSHLLRSDIPGIVYRRKFAAGGATGAGESITPSASSGLLAAARNKRLPINAINRPITPSRLSNAKSANYLHAQLGRASVHEEQKKMFLMSGNGIFEGSRPAPDHPRSSISNLLNQQQTVSINPTRAPMPPPRYPSEQTLRTTDKTPHQASRNSTQQSTAVSSYKFPLPGHALSRQISDLSPDSLRHRLTSTFDNSIPEDTTTAAYEP